MNLAAFICAWVAGIIGVINGAWVAALLAASVILMLWTTVIH